MPAPLQELHLLRWRLAIGRLPIGHAYALESASIEPATLRTQAQQNGKRFALADRAVFADWLEKLRPGELIQSGLGRTPWKAMRGSSPQQITVIAIYHFRDLWKEDDLTARQGIREKALAWQSEV